tara:strand:- start:452 stop:703 length:252 start_codon:yes stop_codon:yes gene_type:complete
MIRKDVLGQAYFLSVEHATLLEIIKHVDGVTDPKKTIGDCVLSLEANSGCCWSVDLGEDLARRVIAFARKEIEADLTKLGVAL